MKILVSVPAKSELGPLPKAVQFFVTEELLVKLEGLHLVLIQNGLASIATFDAVDVWGDPCFAARHRLHDEELVLDAAGFRFVATGRVVGQVSTVALDLQKLAALCRQHSDGAQLQFDATGGLVAASAAVKASTEAFQPA
ncbi:MAG: hypothetical protein HYX47_12960 [Burkholderiales bacterium]|nr:hypothetical protein [Burkholderiales bacterium]